MVLWTAQPHVDGSLPFTLGVSNAFLFLFIFMCFLLLFANASSKLKKIVITVDTVILRLFTLFVNLG